MILAGGISCWYRNLRVRAFDNLLQYCISRTVFSLEVSSSSSSSVAEARSKAVAGLAQHCQNYAAALASITAVGDAFVTEGMFSSSAGSSADTEVSLTSNCFQSLDVRELLALARTMSDIGDNMVACYACGLALYLNALSLVKQLMEMILAQRKNEPPNSVHIEPLDKLLQVSQILFSLHCIPCR